MQFTEVIENLAERDCAFRVMSSRRCGVPNGGTNHQTVETEDVLKSRSGVVTSYVTGRIRDSAPGAPERDEPFGGQTEMTIEDLKRLHDRWPQEGWTEIDPQTR